MRCAHMAVKQTPNIDAKTENVHRFIDNVARKFRFRVNFGESLIFRSDHSPHRNDLAAMSSSSSSPTAEPYLEEIFEQLERRHRDNTFAAMCSALRDFFESIFDTLVRSPPTYDSVALYRSLVSIRSALAQRTVLDCYAKLEKLLSPDVTDAFDMLWTNTVMSLCRFVFSHDLMEMDRSIPRPSVDS